VNDRNESLAPEEPANALNTSAWSEGDSRTFTDYARYFVPDRELQLQIICDLVPTLTKPFHILELCCGEGLLTRALLERFPHSTVHGFDGSLHMLKRAQTDLQKYNERFCGQLFDLAAHDWRTLSSWSSWPLHAVVSSLAVHHLDAREKQELFRDVHRMLQAGGVFVIADVVMAAGEQGKSAAAQSWDESVRQRALELDGNLSAFEYFQRERWNLFADPNPDPMDKPSTLVEQLGWLTEAGFAEADAYRMKAGHAIFGGRKI